MAQDRWTDIGNTSVPFEPLPPDRLDVWFVRRPDSPLETLARQLAPDRLPQQYILVGQPTSGQSSELTKLAAELKNRYNALVVRFDMTDNTDVERANPVEAIFLMGAALFKVAAAELPPNRQPDRRLPENLKPGLETLVHTNTANKTFEINLEKFLGGLVVFGGAALAGPVGAATGLALSPGMAQAIRTFGEKFIPLRFTSGTNDAVVRKLGVGPQVEAMIESLNTIIDDARVKADRPLVLLVDGLDKLRDPDVISLNFLEKKFLNGPRCCVLYTGPLDLYYSPQFGGVRARFSVIAFPHVKLHSRDGPAKRDEHGYQIMRDVATRRLESLGVRYHEAIVPAALNMLIQGSGGVMRDFIPLIQSAALYAELADKERIGKPEAAKALNELRRQLMAQLTPDYHEILSKVRQTHQRVEGEGEGDKCDLLLRNDVVLSYVNDDIWYDVHAVLTPEPWRG